MKARFFPGIPTLILLFLPLLASMGCGSRPHRSGGPPPPGAQPAGESYRTTEQKLYAHFQQWKGAPYRSGGLAASGVDCSGFVYRAFKDRFEISLPRTVRLQAGEGKKVSRRSLRSGDLVFFKTGLFQRHVGIFLEDSAFMHASTKRGVTMSSLDNEYWSRRFWKARRVLD